MTGMKKSNDHVELTKSRSLKKHQINYNKILYLLPKFLVGYKQTLPRQLLIKLLVINAVVVQERGVNIQFYRNYVMFSCFRLNPRGSSKQKKLDELNGSNSYSNSILQDKTISTKHVNVNID